MKLVYQYMVIFFTFSPTSNHLHPLQVKNCGRLERVEHTNLQMVGLVVNKYDKFSRT